MMNKEGFEIPTELTLDTANGEYKKNNVCVFYPLMDEEKIE